MFLRSITIKVAYRELHLTTTLLKFYEKFAENKLKMKWNALRNKIIYT